MITQIIISSMQALQVEGVDGLETNTRSLITSATAQLDMKLM